MGRKIFKKIMHGFINTCSNYETRKEDKWLQNCPQKVRLQGTDHLLR
jgi:hypothetical protein